MGHWQQKSCQPITKTPMRRRTEKKTNNTGNCKDFCVTHKRKKTQLLIQIDISQRVQGVEGSDQFRISLLDLALILNIYFSLYFILTHISSFS